MLFFSFICYSLIGGHLEMLLAVREGGRWAVQACPLHGCSSVWKPSSEPSPDVYPHFSKTQRPGTTPEVCCLAAVTEDRSARQRHRVHGRANGTGAGDARGVSSSDSLSGLTGGPAAPLHPGRLCEGQVTKADAQREAREITLNPSANSD